MDKLTNAYIQESLLNDVNELDNSNPLIFTQQLLQLHNSLTQLISDFQLYHSTTEPEEIHNILLNLTSLTKSISQSIYSNNPQCFTDYNDSLILTLDYIKQHISNNPKSCFFQNPIFDTKE